VVPPDAVAVSVKPCDASTVPCDEATVTVVGLVTVWVYETVEVVPVSVLIYRDMVYDPGRESDHVGLAADVEDRDPADDDQWYVPPSTSSKLALLERSTVPPVVTGFGDPETEDRDGG